MARRRAIWLSLAGAVAAGGFLTARVLPNGCAAGPGRHLIAVDIAGMGCDPRFGMFVDHRPSMRFAIAMGGLFLGALIAALATRHQVRSPRDRIARSPFGTPHQPRAYALATVGLLAGAAFFVFNPRGCAPWQWFSCAQAVFGSTTQVAGLIVSLGALALVLLAFAATRRPRPREQGTTLLAVCAFASAVVLAVGLPGGCGPMGPYLACRGVPRIGARVGIVLAGATLAIGIRAIDARRSWRPRRRAAASMAAKIST